MSTVPSSTAGKTYGVRGSDTIDMILRVRVDALGGDDSK